MANDTTRAGAAATGRPAIAAATLVPPAKPFPAAGRPADEVLAELRERKAGDADWRGGRVPLFVFKADDAVYELGRAAFVEYFAENALGAQRAFPSVRGLEQEVVAMALDLFHAPVGAAGFMSTGGTESIVLAVQAARNHARASRRDPAHRGNIVAAESVHPAFDKAAALMDLTVRRLPVGADWRADVAAIDAAIDADTIMVVGSAPCFPYGVIDPIEQLSALARRRGTWLHVDACVGGYLAPFVQRLGRPVPAFDFALPGVRSISADLHKYGFCPKPASTVLYRGADDAAHQPFVFDAWPSGLFATPTLVGTRPAGGVAAAWATMQHLGAAGYERIAGELMAAIDRYRAGIAAIDGLRVIGDPHLAIVAFGADGIDVYAVAETMAARGWQPGLLRKPRAIHRMMSMLHAGSMDAYLADLREAVARVRAGGAASGLQARY